MVYFDVKLADPELHRRHVGVDNRLILENLGKLARQIPRRLLVRVPLVPGVTDGRENLEAIAGLLRGFGLGRAALLPYNPLWLSKRDALGMEPAYRHDKFMPPEEIARAEEVFSRAGIRPVGASAGIE